MHKHDGFIEEKEFNSKEDALTFAKNEAEGIAESYFSEFDHVKNDAKSIESISVYEDKKIGEDKDELDMSCPIGYFNVREIAEDVGRHKEEEFDDED